MIELERRYHVPGSQVWAGSRGGQAGKVHLHVVGERFDVGRIHRKRGDALCGKRGWFERPPEESEETCPRCAELAARADSPAERERRLRLEYDERRMQAPNPRDFPNWNAFYEAQAEHEAELSDLSEKIESCVEW